MASSGKRRTLVLLGLAATLLLISLLGAGGLRRYARLAADVRRIAGENEELRQKNARLRREAHALEGEPKALERAAREDLTYVRPGEFVIHLDEPGAR